VKGTAGTGSIGAVGPSEHLAAIVESSDDAILSKDRDGVITTWNPGAQRIYGYTEEEAIGRPISMLIPEHRAGEERDILARILRGEHVDHYETERVTKDGRTINVSLTVSPIRDGTGEVVAASVIARDITPRQRTLTLASMLHDLTSALSREATLDRVTAVALRHLVGALEAEAGSLGLVEGDQVVIAGSVGHSASGLARWSRFPVAADVPMSEAIRTGEPIWIATAEELRNRYPSLHGTPIRFEGLAVLPFAAGGPSLGAISLSFGRALEFGAEERAFVGAASHQVAAALRRAILFQREHEAAVILQRSLLPASLPPPEAGFAFDARYRPAAPGLEVGGDWYDAVVLEDGAIALTIGDVAGRGIGAASVMGRIRPALRAYVLDGHGPAETVGRLDRLLKENEPPEMATVFHLQFDPWAHAARYVRAGHPPALLRTPDGEVAELRGEGAPPLGIFDDVEFSENGEGVPPGSLVLLYTDGLIERRDTPVDLELERLKACLARGPGEPGECLDWLEEEIAVDALPDDVAMVAMSTPTY
jgi:PAS domain S-box-containing protein